MFEKIKSFFVGVGSAVMPVKTIEQALGVEMAVGPDMENAIGLWSDMYINEPPWRYTDNEQRPTLNLAAAIAGEFARLTTLELKSAISGSARAEYLNGQYQRIIPELRRQVEYGCAKGGLVFKPYVSGGDIVVDYVQADSFFPTAFDSSGRMTAAVFVDRLVRGKKVYTRLEYHHIEATGCAITNTAYANDCYGGRTDVLGVRVPLSAVPEWANIEEATNIAGVNRLLIGYFRIPFANTADTHSPLGVSVYSRAVELIHQADEQYVRILWEYEGSELAIDADADALRPENNKHVLPRGTQRLFRNLGLSGGNDGDFYRVFSPAIRDVSLFNGLNRLLRHVEFLCALAYGTLSDPENVDKTAEEIKYSKQRSYSAVSDLQKALQGALADMIYSMDVLASLYRLAPSGPYDVSYNWDDSIIVDAETERLRDKEDVRDGVMHKWEFRMKWYGEDEATAKRMAPDDDMDEDEVMHFADAKTAGRPARRAD